MFENLAEAEENRGLGGFQKRHFSAFVDAEQARSSIAELTRAFLVLTVLQLVVGLVQYFNTDDLDSRARVVGIATVLVAFLLFFVVLWVRLRKNRILAVVYSLFWVFNATSVFLDARSTLGMVLAGLFLAMSIRLVQACLAYHRLPRLAPIDTANFD